MRCDFSSVTQIILSYVAEGNSVNQVEFVSLMFAHFLENNEDFELDNGQICRWLKGTAAVSPKIAAFYLNDTNKQYLSVKIEDNIFPLIYDLNKFAEELYNLLITDISISEKKRAELTVGYPPEENADIADFTANVVVFALERKFEKRDTKALPSSGISPIISELAYIESVPRPCKYFCGRDKELAKLHELLQTKGKVFINGIAGMGKSELAKAYAFEHRRKYSNILFLSYGGSLFDLIADMDFVDDRLEDDVQTRFKKHNRILRAMRENSLIIIDNFNTTAPDEPLLDVVLKYPCRVIFTTRSRFEFCVTLKLNEIESVDTLVNLSSKFYVNALEQRNYIEKIIEVIHHHTLSVELSARLLQKGLIEPDELLAKLNVNSVNPHSNDKIKISKAGLNLKDTYFNHLHTLFSLYLLDEEMQTIMRCMAFVPTSGIRSRTFAKWIKLTDMNGINDLIELGFIQEREFDVIALLPIMRDVCFEDLKPSITNCRNLILSINSICTLHGAELPFGKTMFNVIENIISRAEKDDTGLYILFLENAFEAMEKERFLSGMRNVIHEMELLQINLKPNDTALLWNFKAALEAINSNYKMAVEYSQKAAELCAPEENYLLAANVFQNLGYSFHQLGDLNSAKIYLEQGLEYLEKYGQLNHDFIAFAHNYANLISDCGEPVKAIRALQKCAEMVKSGITDLCEEYADMVFDIGVIYLQIGDNSKAEQNFDEAFRVYRAILPEDALRNKCENALQFFKSTNAKISDCFALGN